MLYLTKGLLAEAEPLMRRHLMIFLDFTRRTGHEHPQLRAAFANYQQLLATKGHSPSEVEAILAAFSAEEGKT